MDYITMILANLEDNICIKVKSVCIEVLHEYQFTVR